jgi:hypothetical protein
VLHALNLILFAFFIYPPLITLFYKVREAMLPAVAARRLFDSGAKFMSVLVVHRDPATGQVL